MSETKTLMDAARFYADKKVCFDTMLSVKWPDGKIKLLFIASLIVNTVLLVKS